MADAADFTPPAKGMSPEIENDSPTKGVGVNATLTQPGPARSDYVQNLADDVQKITAVLPPPDDVPPLVRDFESPVFWMTTIVPVILAVVAYCFHHDLGQEATGLAALGAAVTTLGYTVYRAVYRHAHMHAYVVNQSLKSSTAQVALQALTGTTPRYY